MTTETITLEIKYAPSAHGEQLFGIIPDIPGCISQGKTVDELKTNLTLALKALVAEQTKSLDEVTQKCARIYSVLEKSIEVTKSAVEALEHKEKEARHGS